MAYVIGALVRAAGGVIQKVLQALGSADSGSVNGAALRLSHNAY